MELKDLINKIIDGKYTSVEDVEKELFLIYDQKKYNHFITAKHWGYHSYVKDACGIMNYALPLFIEDFESWYEQNHNV